MNMAVVARLNLLQLDWESKGNGINASPKIIQATTNATSCKLELTNPSPHSKERYRGRDIFSITTDRHGNQAGELINQPALSSKQQIYWLIITRFASASKSIYGVPSTVTPTRSIVPPLNLLGDGYNSLTASPLS